MSQTKLALFIAATLLPIASEVRGADPIDYPRAVKPILAARCYACHGALKQKSHLRLDTVKLMKKGGDSGPALVPGDSAKSLLVAHITGRDNASRMPPESEGEPLKPSQIALIQNWIDQGAVGPADEKPEIDPKDHWAFKAPVRQPVPQIRSSQSTIRNPIDAFLAAAWEKQGLVPQPPPSGVCCCGASISI